MDFTGRLSDTRPMIIDGAMGTLIFKMLPGYSGCMELLNLEKPDVIHEIHKSYIEAGADIIETNTLGGSSLKLSEYGLGHKCEEINERGAVLARNASGGRIFVAGSIGSTGKFIRPIGDISFNEAFDSFSRQVKGLERGGADLIAIETMTDLQEAKIALLAAKSSSKLPVICSMTFEETGRTVSGTDMLSGFATLAEYGADAVGANCSMGPDGLLKIFTMNIERLRAIGIPLMVWANAGMPDMIDGKAVYSISPESFAETSARFAEIGLKIIGGCCGTAPEHIAALKRRLSGFTLRNHAVSLNYNFITSRYRAIDLSNREGILKIGERLNPTARKKFAEELKTGQNAFLREESKKQEDEGALILDINVGVPSIDEVQAMEKSIAILTGTVKTPLMIDSDNVKVLESALKNYPGVGIVNSINGKKKSIDTVLPLIKRYGCFIIALCLDDTGIHRDSKKRIEIGEKLLETLTSEGIALNRIFIDPLMLAESAEPGSAMETLKVIEHFSQRGVKTSIGLSNISFGLPQRKHINNVFLNLAADKGLTAAIINPSAVKTGGVFTDDEKAALDFLQGLDPKAAGYIARFGKEQEKAPASLKVPEHDLMTRIFNMVIDGNADEMAASIEEAALSHSPEDIMNDTLIKALEKVGEYYTTGYFFLPQMISSAQAMKAGFETLKPRLSQKTRSGKGRVVICTVKGDVHDIGKNIVGMMLENHGFEVIDLGKDVPNETVIDAIIDKKPDILCLSSLLTTTMNEMVVISDIINAKKLPVKLLIGGAVVNREFAEKIGAHYGADAIEGAKIAGKILGKSQ
jgi:5-methyltetrahydrofolate--homocysteine methyltransferase